MQRVMAPLVTDPRTQLCLFAVLCWDIAVPVDFAIIGKLAQNIFLIGAVAIPFETHQLKLLDTEDSHG
jgi:hypothetical protein